MKAPKIAEFREKITLCRLVSTVDSELNRVETAETVQQVWANVTAKSNVDTTVASTRPELHYQFIIRKQNIVCDAIKYRGRLLMLTEPWYEIGNKYIVLKAGEIVGQAD